MRKGSIVAIILSLVLGAGVGYTFAPREVIEGVDPVLHQNQIDQLEDTIALLESQIDIRLINISFSRTGYTRGSSST